MSQWIEFESVGAKERINNTENVDKIGLINIQYSKTDGIYDLIVFHNGKYWMYKYSFTSLSEAQSRAKSLSGKMK